MAYYHAFIEQFKDVSALADASEDQVLATWQGLGYYSRARNLHHTAKAIVEDFHGQFPADYLQLKKFRGIGNYTAAAIASMAFGLPHAAIDGNVVRVLTRYFAIDLPIDNSAVKKQIESIAEGLLDKSNPGDFNQAMMDFGSMVCKPRSPDCHLCPFVLDCRARSEGRVDNIPHKKKQVTRKKRYFHYFLFYCQHEHPISIYVEKRQKKDIWKNLYQLPLLETPSVDLADLSLIKDGIFKKIAANGLSIELQGVPVHVSHQLTHQQLEVFFYKTPIPAQYCFIFDQEFIKVSLQEFEQLGKPVIISRYMDKIGDLSIPEKTAGST